MTEKPRRVRADELIVQLGLADSRSQAKALILAGDVRAGDRVINRPAEMLDDSLALTLKAKLPYVSRGGLKLEHALETFGISVEGSVAADLGASTGGFTDCMLQRGVRRVYAIDVGYGQLDYRLRSDDRVVVMERVNARHLEALPEPVELVSIDVSFISLALILPVAYRLLTDSGSCIALIKPQFEAGKQHVGKGGVVRDLKIRRQVIAQTIDTARTIGFGARGLVRSPITGPAGNVEFLVWLDKRAELDVGPSFDALITREVGE
ncbi:MAG: TlyA family RNA methyltransferase [Thermomicrobiales bacterium]|nr:TlyA family RNA methyltransferase [Thermomicrobiales bacterium]